MPSFKILLALFLSIFFKTEAARILAAFPTPSISHQVAFRPVIHELAKRGHDVTVITPDPAFPKDKSPTNLTEIDVHDFSYELFRGLLDNNQGIKGGLIKQVQEVFIRMAKIFERQMQVPECKKLLNEKFDLLIVEAYVRPTLGLSHVLKAPVIQFSSLGTAAYGQYGAPSHPLLYPSPGAQRLYNLTLFEKAQELFKAYALDYIVSKTLDYENEMIKKIFGNDAPSFKELEKNVQMLFVNEHPIWADNHPVPPNILYVGGIHQTPEKELPQNLKNILDASKNGVIYVSFGTNVRPSLLPPERIAVMTKVLSKLPYDVLWKWDKDVLPGQSTNIKIFKWFPQSDLLKHPKLKLFITQGGIQSSDEAINAAVPLIGIPMIADQWYNVEKYVKHGVGLQLDIHSLTEENFKNAVETVINDKTFKNNMVRLRSLMRDHPIPPVDLAVWWVEHILKHGGQHLRSPAAGLSWAEYYEIPLILLILGVFVSALSIIVLTTIFVVKLFINFLEGNNVNKKKQKRK